MTSKLSFIAFVPFSLAAIAIKVIQLFFMDVNGLFFGFNNLMLSYLAIACSVIVLLFAVIFCLIDKKTAPVYTIKRNFVSGLLGLLLAVSFACEGANRAFLLFGSTELAFVEIADTVLTLLCAIVFVVIALNHFVGSTSKGLALFYLVPAIWSAFRLVACFLEFTTVSIAVTDVTVLACYIFATLFLFNYAMIISKIKGKSPVRSAFIYGLPAVTILLAHSIYELTNALVYKSSAFNIFSDIQSIELGLLSLYILSFVVEMSICVKRKDEIEYLEEEKDENIDEETVESVDTSVAVTHEETPDTSSDVEETNNTYPVQEDNTNVTVAGANEDEMYSTMDRIDKLILEITEE